jgi:hypothetical protein
MGEMRGIVASWELRIFFDPAGDIASIEIVVDILAQSEDGNAAGEALVCKREPSPGGFFFYSSS